ncbi:EthD family reductase [Granulicoccus phenolivorans]|uniref:EthD family reductase n=1 Tax=Granulicoccus phenolivorans TaxID=266854 RepID=UPI000423D020|nr:EthD family reductase [Granulicoccus phenolivorans]
MFRIVVTYNHPENTDAFLEHYRTSHAVKAGKMPNLAGYTWGQCESLDGSRPEHFLVAVMDYESKEAAGASLGSPEGQAATADMADLPHAGFTMNSYAY